MRCGDCQFWGDKSETFEQAQGFKTCQRIHELWSITEWVKDVFDLDWDTQMQLKAEHSADLAAVQDGSSYMAELKTKADFFCAHFEQRQ